MIESTESGRKFRAVSKYALLLTATSVVFWWTRTRPVPVTAHQIKSEVIAAETMGTGTLEARIEATVSPKIQGRLTEVLWTRTTP